MRPVFLVGWFCLILAGCNVHNSDSGEAQTIVNKAIAAHGGEAFNTIDVAFDFRDRHYTAVRQNGLYTYSRSFTDSTGHVEDVLTNSTFIRKINGVPVKLPAERIKAFSQSVNSVIYFALLPYGLNDPAVQKKYRGQTTIQGQPYHKIEVTFAEEGGGIDFEDRYIYWFHQKLFTLDYLAYSFHTDGGGLRFRKSYQPQVIKNIRFQQYINYEPAGQASTLESLEEEFKEGKLKELSRIELLHIQVK